MANSWQQLDTSTRRQFLAGAARAALGVSVLPAPSALAAPGRSARRAIYVFLEGALSQIDTLDPKPGVEQQGPTKAVGTKLPGVQLGEHLPRLAQALDQVALIRSLTTETGAHQPGRYLMRTSYKAIATTRHPSLGAWLQKLDGKGHRELPGSVVVGGGSRHPGAGFLGAGFAPAPVANPAAGLPNTKPPKYLSEAQFDKRMSLASRFDRPFRRRFQGPDIKSYVDFYREAVALLKSQGLEAFDIDKEPEQIRQAYGNDRLGQGCLLARRLIEADVRFVEVVSGGWDHHRDVFSVLPGKAAALDQALTALLADLQSRGLLQDTLVVVTTEFGRTPKINQNTGRDHHPGVFSGLLAGGGVQGGQVHGASDRTAQAVEDDPVYPADLNATIAYALGLPRDREVVSPVGRPFRVAHDGQPVTALF